MSSKSQKRQRLIGFIFVNTIHSDTNPVLGHVLVHFVGKTNLVVTVELIWLFLNILCFNFVLTLNKSLRFTRFGRSYVNRNCYRSYQSYTAFLLYVRCSKWPHFFLCSGLSQMHLCNPFLLSTHVTQILSISRWLSRRKDVKWLSFTQLSLPIQHRQAECTGDLKGLVNKVFLNCKL